MARENRSGAIAARDAAVVHIEYAALSCEPTRTWSNIEDDAGARGRNDSITEALTNGVRKDVGNCQEEGRESRTLKAKRIIRASWVSRTDKYFLGQGWRVGDDWTAQR